MTNCRECGEYLTETFAKPRCLKCNITYNGDGRKCNRRFQNLALDNKVNNYEFVTTGSKEEKFQINSLRFKHLDFLTGTYTLGRKDERVGFGRRALDEWEYHLIIEDHTSLVLLPGMYVILNKDGTINSQTGKLEFHKKPVKKFHGHLPEQLSFTF